MEESRLIEMIKRNPTIIETIDNPTDEMKLLAIGKNGLLLRDIKNPTREMEELAIENNPRAIQYVKETSEELQVLAVRKNYDSIKYIKEPCERVQEEAVKIKHDALRYIKSPSFSAQVLAVKNNESSISFVSDLDKDKILEFLKANILVSKYITNKIPKEELEEVLTQALKETLSSEDVEEKYVRDFLNCSIIDRNSSTISMDKILFIHKYGSKKAKKIAVDEKLKMM